MKWVKSRTPDLDFSLSESGIAELTTELQVSFSAKKYEITGG